MSYRIKVITVDGVVLTLTAPQDRWDEKGAKEFITETLAGNNLIVPSERGFHFIPATQIKRIEVERINDE